MGCAARGGANQGGPGGAPSAAPRRGPGLSLDRGRGAREAHVRLRQGRGCARNAAGGWPRRRFKCIPGLGDRGAGSEFPSQPRLRSPAWPAAPGSPLSGPPGCAGPLAYSRDPAPGPRPQASQVQRGGSAWKRSPTSSPRCSEGNLDSAGNCSSAQPAPLQSALALLKRSSSHQSLASPSPRKPRAGL